MNESGFSNNYTVVRLAEFISHHNVEDMLKELNKINKKIKFTVEKMNDGMLPFLDCCLSIDGNKIKTKVYRKKTHTGQYNNFKSNQPLQVKKSTITCNNVFRNSHIVLHIILEDAPIIRNTSL